MDQPQSLLDIANRIGRRYLHPNQLCFPLQLTRRQVRNAIRREELPRAGRGRVDANALRLQLLGEGDLLGARFIEAWMEGRYDIYEPAGVDEKPPYLEANTRLLRQPMAGAQRHFGSEVRKQAKNVRYIERFA